MQKNKKKNADSVELQVQMRPLFIAIIQSATAGKDSRMVFVQHVFFIYFFPRGSWCALADVSLS